jgi:hypothetical protein
MWRITSNNEIKNHINLLLFCEIAIFQKQHIFLKSNDIFKIYINQFLCHLVTALYYMHKFTTLLAFEMLALHKSIFSASSVYNNGKPSYIMVVGDDIIMMNSNMV